MKEQFSSDFRLNSANQNIQGNFKTLNNEEFATTQEELFDFNAQDKFSSAFQKNKLESEYILMSAFEKDTAKAKQLEREITQIKTFENENDYFNF